MPYDESDIRSIYHIREYDVYRLAQVGFVTVLAFCKLSSLQLSRTPSDIFLSHDWPTTIAQYGDTRSLLRAKPFFREEVGLDYLMNRLLTIIPCVQVQNGTLGSPPLLDLLKILKPTYWFAAHLHVKFAALVKHDGQPTNIKQRQRRPRADNAVDDGEADPSEHNRHASITTSEATLDAAAQPDSNIDESMDLAEVKRLALARLESLTATANGHDEIELDVDLEDHEIAETTEDNPEEISIDIDEPEPEAAAETPAPVPVEDNPEEIDIDMDDEIVEDSARSMIQAPATPRGRATKFLALSKCGFHNDFLQVRCIAILIKLLLTCRLLFSLLIYQRRQSLSRLS